MTQQHPAPHHGPSWYKIFALVLSGLYLMFLIMVSQCTLSLETPDAALNSALCLAYGVLAAACLLLGLMVCLVGIEHAKRHHKARTFYFSMIIFFLVSAVIFLFAEIL